MILSGVTIYPLLQCGHAKSQIDANSTSIDKGLFMFLTFKEFTQSLR